ncbi:hypothetical protein BHM03_00032258, partial [Ensete ventricosum]
PARTRASKLAAAGHSCTGAQQRRLCFLLLLRTHASTDCRRRPHLLPAAPHRRPSLPSLFLPLHLHHRRCSTRTQPPSFPPAPAAGQRRCLPCSQPQPPLGAPHADATASSLSRCRSPRRTAAALTFLQSPLLPAAKSSFPPFLPQQLHVSAALSLGRLFLRPPLFLSSLCCHRNLLLDRCPHFLLQKTASATATASSRRLSLSSPRPPTAASSSPSAITNLQSRTMITNDALDVKFKACETHMEDKFQELIREIRRNRSESPNKTQYGENFKGSRSEKYDH